MPSKKRKVLVVEDEAPLRKIMVSKLKESGFEVLEASNGKQGLKKAKKEHPNLILLDIIMPEMDGLEMLRLLREDKWGKNAEVVILSVVNNPKEVQKAMEEKVFNFWVKSDWKLSEIIKEVKDRLK